MKKLIVNHELIAKQAEHYQDLSDHPRINNVELVGNTTLNELGLYSKEEVRELISQTTGSTVKIVERYPDDPEIGVLYYVGSSENGYVACIYTKNDAGVTVRNDLGNIDASMDLNDYQTKLDNTLETNSKTIVNAINELKAAIEAKQTKEDSSLVTTDKTVVGAIKEISEMQDYIFKTDSIKAIEVVDSLPINPVSTTLYLIKN